MSDQWALHVLHLAVSQPTLGVVIDLPDGVAEVLGYLWTQHHKWLRIEHYVPYSRTGRARAIRAVYCAGPDDLTDLTSEQFEHRGYRPPDFGCTDCALGMCHTTALHDAVASGDDTADANTLS